MVTMATSPKMTELPRAEQRSLGILPAAIANCQHVGFKVHCKVY